MVDAWPGTVNLFVKRDSYGEEPERHVVRSAPDKGPPLERRSSTFVSDLISCEGRYTATEYAALKTFYRTTLMDGVLPFTRAHPLTGAAGALMKFEAAPKLVRVGALYRHVALSLRTLP